MPWFRCSGPHRRVLPLQQIREPDLQLLTDEPGRPDLEQGVRDPVAKHVPQERGP